MSTAPNDWTTVASTVAAIASTIAAFSSLVVTIWAAWYQDSRQEKRARRENRLYISKFIQELNAAATAAYALANFDNLDIPAGNIPALLDSATKFPDQYLQAFNRAEAELHRFDEDSAQRVIDAVRGVRRFIERCRRLAERSRDSDDEGERAEVLRGFDHAKGQLEAVIVELGPHLVRYGAEPLAWQGESKVFK